MFIIGSCLVLSLRYVGCCKWSLSPQCDNNGCYCDQYCHKWNDCCSDVADIGCHPIPSLFPTPIPTYILGKTDK